MTSSKAFAVFALLFISSISSPLHASPAEGRQKLRVMQLNIWGNAVNIPNGKQRVADYIANYDPHIVMLCETRGAKDLKAWLKPALAKHRLNYHFINLEGGQQVISKFPIIKTQRIPGAGNLAVINANGKKIHACSVHLYYRDYACYLPRGYHGDTWKKIEPVSDVKDVIAMNERSKRYLAIRRVVKATEQARKKGELVLIAGDFNEPSHLDWTPRTKDLFDHNGIVMPWHSSIELQKANFQDTYRQIHPDEVSFPAFTFPMNNVSVPISSLTWAPLADERDRIDFIYYSKDAKVKLTRAGLMGPQTTILRGKRDPNPQTGDYIVINENWPTDHAGTFAEFEL